MAFTDINSEDRLVQQTLAEYLHEALGWDTAFAWNQETFGPDGLLGRADTREVVLKRDLRAALVRLNPDLPDKAIDEAMDTLTRHNFSRSLIQHNEEFHKLIRDGVTVNVRDANGHLRQPKVRVIDFRNPSNNRFLAVRELKITGVRSPGYSRRADLVCCEDPAEYQSSAFFPELRSGEFHGGRHGGYPVQSIKHREQRQSVQRERRMRKP